MKPTETRVTQIVVCPQGEPLYSDAATTVQITDEAGGEFVEVSQDAQGQGKIWINPEEWPALRSAINRLIKQCRDTP